MKRRAPSRPAAKRSRGRTTLGAQLKAAQLAEAKLRKALATYKIAEVNRFTRDWRARRRSADAAIVPDAPMTLGRVRQLVRDDAYAASAVRAFERNVVGRGVQITATKRADDATPDAEWKESSAAYWDAWANDPTVVDLEQRRTFHMVLRWCVREMVIAGEALIVTWTAPEANAARPSMRPGVRLQLIEAEQLDQMIQSVTVTEGGREITRRVVGGIEIDESNVPIAYHFSQAGQDQLPNADRKGGTQRISASRVLHFYDPERASQTRGVSRMSSVGLRIRHLSEYDSAQLVAARAEACIGLVTKMVEPAAPFGTPTEPESEDSESSSDSSDTTTAQAEAEMNPLMVARLGPNEEVHPFIPTRPGNLYDPFVKAQLRAIAAGLGISYELIARDFTGGTYSSQRQGMLEDRREFRLIQQLLIALVVRPIRKLVIEDGITRGALSAPGYTESPERWLAARYMPDGWSWIDPEKEANGAREAIALGITTREKVCGEQAEDWEAITEQLGIEKRVRIDEGLEAGSVVSSDGAASAAVQDTALNGAQVTSLLELVRAAKSGEIEVAAAKVLAQVAFPMIDAARIDAMFKQITPRPFVDPSTRPPQAPSASTPPRKGAAMAEAREILKLIGLADAA